MGGGSHKHAVCSHPPPPLVGCVCAITSCQTFIGDPDVVWVTHEGLTVILMADTQTTSGGSGGGAIGPGPA